MKILFGAMVVDGSGKLGGHVASKNKSGHYFRTKVTPSNPQTAAQVASRNGLRDGSQAWNGLTSAIMQGWANLAKEMKKTNYFGSAVTGSGFNLFVSMRKLTLLAGAPNIDEAPVPVENTPIATLSVAQDGSTGAITATFTPAIPDDCVAVIEATEPLKIGQFSVKSKFRKIAVKNDQATSPAVITSDYNAKFPEKLTTGKKAYFRAYFMNPAFPMVSGKLTSNAVESAYTPS